MSRKELIKKYLKFFESKNHKIIPAVPLLPKGDSSVLFTTAGMHPLIPYLLGKKHPSGKRLVNVQKCIRTTDIEKVGNNYHHTFFEMLGNWSLGNYWKKEAIEWSLEFLTRILKLEKEKIAVSVFEGDSSASRDIESAKIWKSLGISEKRIAFLNKEENWWGPVEKTGICGPDTEIFYWNSEEMPAPEKFDFSDKRWVEIGNNVLLQYSKNEKGIYEEAKQKNIDFGGGVERIITILNGFEDNYLTDIWKPIIEKIEKISKKNYENSEYTRSFRIIADHIKASVFILAEGIIPSNTKQGYVLRRLIRRTVRHAKELDIKENLSEITKPVFDMYSDYKILKENRNKIIRELDKEEEIFLKKLEQGEKILKKIIHSGKKILEGKIAFLLYQSYGFPLELTKETAERFHIKVDEKGFEKELKKHQEISRTASIGKFKSGLSDFGEKTIKLHTVTHLLNEALRIVLNNPKIFQKGSNINSERLRFDFNFDRKLTEEEKKKIENWINEKIKENLPVTFEEMSLKQAKQKGAQGVFEDKYAEKIKVYFIGHKGKEISKEICNGPHVKNIGEIGKFRIKKEEAIAAGIRRIKGVIE
ncbi:alanine--tRNA ligase [Candidatus Pacearchaeota archaeon]|nr:alanine--tRNA ligase [Candidatus Pacearchaeota archaeon]